MADIRSTLQFHQQRLIPEVDGFLTTSVVLPPDSEIVATFSVSGVRPTCCSLVEPSRTLTEEYGVIEGHTFVDASSRSASVLMVNPSRRRWCCPVLPVWVNWCARFRWLSRILPISRACRTRSGLLCRNIWRKSSWDRTLLWVIRDLLYRYGHVFLAPGEPVTGRTTSVQHDILKSDARPVRCRPRRLAPAGLRMCSGNVTWGSDRAK